MLADAFEGDDDPETLARAIASVAGAPPEVDDGRSPIDADGSSAGAEALGP